MNSAVRKIIAIIAAVVFIFSVSMVLREHFRSNASAQITENMVQSAVSFREKEVFGDSKDEIIAEDDVSDKFNLAETRKPPIHVDFEFLLEQNDDIVAWIYSPDTPINYPVVQTADNEYYLRRLVDGSTNPYGTIFLDYRNASDFYDWNSIIYGHNMKNESMFGTLLLYKEQSYFEEHPELYLISPDRSYKIILIAGFETDAASNIYNSFNADNAQKTLLLEAWLNASDFDSKFVASENSRFITLSTCSYESDDARYVLVGVLESY